MQTFAFAFEPQWKPFLRLLGVTPLSSGVDVDDDTLLVRFGPWRVKTPLSNVGDLHITENYRWYTAFGPRSSWVDHGISFGTNNKRGLCIGFKEPVSGLLPFGIGRHPALTVTVADVEGLRNALAG